jgi:integrase
MARFQNGWLRKKHRKSGEVWLFCYRQRRQEDGKWVEATPIRVGSLKEFPSEETAWRRVEELRLNPNQSTFGVSPQATFGQLAAHYTQHELPENQENAQIEKAYSTILKYRRYLKRWALPRWETTPALTVEPIEVERWLKALRKKHGLENSTLVEIRKVMNLVYKHGQRYGLLPRSDEGNPIHFVRQSSKSDFEPVILTLPQVLDIFDNLDLMRRTMVLTDAATALRVSEILALMWKDLDFVAQLIRVRRAYVSAVLEPRNRRPQRLRFRCILCSRHICSLGVRKRSMPPTKTWFSRVFAPRAPSLPRLTCWLPITCAWPPRRRE